MKSVLVWLCVAAVLIGLFGAYSTMFPGVNAPAKGGLADDGEVVSRLRDHVESIALGTAPRHSPGPIADAGDYLERQLRRTGHDVKAVAMGPAAAAKTIIVDLPGTKYAREIVIVASHFDGPRGSPGADSGASGAAVLVEVARAMYGAGHERTLRFVLFPDGYSHHDGPDSAAAAYAKQCKSSGEKVVAVVYLDSVGLFDDADTQTYPFPLMLAYPSKANFIAVIGSYGARDLTSKATELLRTGTGVAVEALVLPAFAPGTGFSPHAAFWDAGMPAVVISDTGDWRSKRFATASDTQDRLDYGRMARLVNGLSRMLAGLVKKATLSA